MPRRIFLAIVLALSVRKAGGGGGVSRSIKPSLQGADILTTQFSSTSEILVEIG